MNKLHIFYKDKASIQGLLNHVEPASLGHIEQADQL